MKVNKSSTLYVQYFKKIPVILNISSKKTLRLLRKRDLTMNKIAMISGSATGIGRASAIQLAKDGFNLVLCDFNKEEGEKTAAQCKEYGTTVDFLHVDMGVEEQVKHFAEFTKDKYGTIDFYFNNQGVLSTPKLFHDITEEDLDRVIYTNFKACFFGMKHVAKIMMKQKHGHILVTSSSSGIRSETGFAAYSATKRAVLGLAQCAAIEYAPYNVRVNSLCPGGIVTPMTDKVGAYMTEEKFIQPKPSTALLNNGALARPEEVSGLVSFLASEGSSYMTGAVLSVDGGNTL